MSSPSKLRFTDRESAKKWFEETYVTDTEYILACNLMRMQIELRKQNEVLRGVVLELNKLVGLPTVCESLQEKNNVWQILKQIINFE